MKIFTLFHFHLNSHMWLVAPPGEHGGRPVSTYADSPWAALSGRWESSWRQEEHRLWSLSEGQRCVWALLVISCCLGAKSCHHPFSQMGRWRPELAWYGSTQHMAGIRDRRARGSCPVGVVPGGLEAWPWSCVRAPACCRGRPPHPCPLFPSSARTSALFTGGQPD